VWVGGGGLRGHVRRLFVERSPLDEPDLEPRCVGLWVVVESAHLLDGAPELLLLSRETRVGHARVGQAEHLGGRKGSAKGVGRVESRHRNRRVEGGWIIRIRIEGCRSCTRRLAGAPGWSRGWGSASKGGGRVESRAHNRRVSGEGRAQHQRVSAERRRGIRIEECRSCTRRLAGAPGRKEGLSEGCREGRE